MYKRIKTIMIIPFILFYSCFMNSDKAYGSKYNSDNLEPTKLLVKYINNIVENNFKDQVTVNSKRINIKVKKTFNKLNIQLVEYTDNEDILSVIRELEKNKNIKYVQPDYELSASFDVNDPMYINQWALKNTGQQILGQIGTTGIDINVLPAWDISVGTNDVVIGILDTGIDINHNDLINNIFVNPAEIPNNNIDDDTNGYIDDTNGWDFKENDNPVYDSSTQDSHGTHVAGIIGASSNNYGICGVAPNVRILPLKFISGVNGYTSDAIEAIEYAENLGVKIINCSWSGMDYNPALFEAISSTDILFICASGNYATNVSTTPVYPACFNLSNIISVAAINNRGTLWQYSNFGMGIDITAPGESILSTLPDNDYGYMSGTSMAAPHVTGVAGLIKSLYPDITYSEISSRIKQNVYIISSLKKKISTSGLVSAYKALMSPPSDGDSGKKG